MNQPSPTKNNSCKKCGTTLAETALICPACHQLVHSEQLKSLASRAKIYTDQGDKIKALTVWRDAIELLPIGSIQYNTINQKIDRLSRDVDKLGLRPTHKKSKIPKSLATFGVIGLLIWKFKFILTIILTKGKLLLVGLTKSQTLFSMFISFGAYWAIWGWKFALGVVLSIYVHEMGHVFALRRFGIRSSLPTFIPGLGALIRMKQSPANPIEDARVGLAGPWWGLFAALVAYSVFLITDWQSWGAIAQVGAWINLFNLLPLVPLDGGRGFRALTTMHRVLACTVILGMWFFSREGLLLLLLLMGIITTFAKSPQKDPDMRTLIEYIALIISLTLLTMIKIKIPV